VIQDFTPYHVRILYKVFVSNSEQLLGEAGVLEVPAATSDHVRPQPNGSDVRRTIDKLFLSPLLYPPRYVPLIIPPPKTGLSGPKVRKFLVA
jgi:hypothetical protein